MTIRIGLLKIAFIALMTLQVCTARESQMQVTSVTINQKIEPRDTNVVYASGMCMGILGTTTLLLKNHSPLSAYIGKGLILGGTVVVGYDLVKKGSFLLQTLYKTYVKKIPEPENDKSLIESTYTNFIINLSVSAILCLIYSEGKTFLETGLLTR